MPIAYFSSEKFKTPHAFFSKKSDECNDFDFSKNSKNIILNKQKVLDQFKSFNKIMTLKQVHGGKVIFCEKYQDSVEADALVTKSKDILIGVITADCAPILLYDKKAEVAAAVHAGWRGAVLNSIIENTVNMMKNDLGCKNITSVIGPCIKHYEVKDDVKNFINSKYIKSYKDRFLFDLTGFVKNTLYQNNVNNLDEILLDTYFNEDLFFSCRRAHVKQEDSYGCQLSVIGLN